MNQNQLVAVIAFFLILSFVLGWLARWLFDRLNRSAPIAGPEAMQRMRDAEQALENREREFSATEAQYANAYAQLEAELDAAMSGLGDARRETAELRRKIEENS